MRALDLFAGAGGAALGLRAAGYQHVACVEHDPAACATLRAAGLPAVEQDIREVDWAPYRGVDLVWASPPCQAFSSAGSRLAARDPRNGWPWLFDALDEVRPTWVIAENVPGLWHHLAAVCGDTRACPGCYFLNCVYPAFEERFPWVGRVKLDAADYGVPQHRRRVFVVGGPRPIQWPEPTHGPPGQLGLFGARRPWVSCGEALGLSGTRRVDSGQARSSSTLGAPAPTVRIVGRSGRPQSQRELLLDRPADTLAAGGTAGGSKAPYVVVVGGGTNPHAPTERRTERDITDEPSTTIPAMHAGSNAVPQLARPSPTVTATEGRGCAGDQRRASRAVRRRLTPAECATLQGFPPHPWQGTKTARYRQIGNAVPPALAEALGRAVRNVARIGA